MFNAALPKTPSISPGASISLQQGQHRGSSATQSRQGSPECYDKENHRSSAADGSVRAPVGIKLAWKEQGRNKAPQEAMQSSHIFQCFCSPSCN